MSAAASRVTIENVNHPGNARSVDAAMYAAMKQAVLSVLPATAPGLTADQLREQVVTHLPPSLFPGGARAGWWTKAVQLDLEAKGLIRREPVRPLRLHRG